jgi:hypothetical protein
MLALLLAGVGCGINRGADKDSDLLLSAAAVQVTATAQPVTVRANEQVEVSLSVTAKKPLDVDVTLTVTAPDGTSAHTGTFPAQPLSTTTPLLLVEPFTLDVAAPAGTYTVGVSVTRTGGGVLFTSTNLATFTVASSTCTPACSGKVCGADGCGGSCGACTAGQSCGSSGHCMTSGGAPGTGLTGEYFTDLTLTTKKLQRLDPTVNFDWGGASPDPSLPAQFSVRWSGQVLPPSTGMYTFSTVSDDGARLWVNGQQLVNDWSDTAPRRTPG